MQFHKNVNFVFGFLVLSLIFICLVILIQVCIKISLAFQIFFFYISWQQQDLDHAYPLEILLKSLKGSYISRSCLFTLYSDFLCMNLCLCVFVFVYRELAAGSEVALQVFLCRPQRAGGEVEAPMAPFAKYEVYTVSQKFLVTESIGNFLVSLIFLI